MELECNLIEELHVGWLRSVDGSYP